jgi:hypothetical protein
MSTLQIQQNEIIRIAREFIREAFFGVQNDQWTWFIGHETDAALLGLLAMLSAQQASHRPPGMTRTIAAHAEHLRWHLATVNHTVQGSPWNPDWSQSWSIETVDETGWTKLQADLKREAQQLIDLLDKPITQPLAPPMIQGLLAVSPHAAHHLGTIRAMKQLILQG